MFGQGYSNSLQSFQNASNASVMHFTLVKVLESSGNLVIYMLKLDLLQNDRILILIKLYMTFIYS